MVPSGFGKFGHLSFRHQFSKKSYRLASTASNLRGAQIQLDVLWLELTKNMCFQNIKIKLNSGTWMTLQSSVVIFQVLESFQPQWPLQPQQPQWPQWLQQPHFIKKLLILMVRSSLASKWSNPVPFCGMDNQKSSFLLISGTLCFGGCWGQPMLLFW